MHQVGKQIRHILVDLFPNSSSDHYVVTPALLGYYRRTKVQEVGIVTTGQLGTAATPTTHPLTY